MTEKAEKKRKAEQFTGLSAWLMPRMKISSDRKKAVAPLLIILVLLHCMALRDRRKTEVRKRKPSVTLAELHVRILIGRISPFWWKYGGLAQSCNNAGGSQKVLVSPTSLLETSISTAKLVM